MPNWAAAGLSDHAEDQHRTYLSAFWVIAMQNAAGSLFDDLDAALQSGSSEKRVRTAQRLCIESSEGFE